MPSSLFKDTICAPATSVGISAIGIIRVSGSKTFDIVSKLFKGKNILEAKSHTVHFGEIVYKGNILDEVLLTLFRNPHSYTGEDSIEIGCHGSPYIIQKILEALIHQGARMAAPGEFTQRAFINGKLNLSQAEAVSDLIASESEAGHRMALNQLKGGYSKELILLREQLITFASLIELELDFSEEDVEFASRNEFKTLIQKIIDICSSLAESFSLGNAIKNGVPTVIVGKPNAGKSTLLNALLNEERAIVSDIPGTTRDTIEETLYIDDIAFKLIDTAGIRQHAEHIEAQGIERTLQKIKQASVVIYLFDASEETPEAIIHSLNDIYDDDKSWILVANKSDKLGKEKNDSFLNDLQNKMATPFSIASYISISSIEKSGIEELKTQLRKSLPDNAGYNGEVVSNLRHYEALMQTKNALQEVLDGMELHISSDLLAVDIRRGLQALGEITGGAISSEDLLITIFSRFCIGK